MNEPSTIAKPEVGNADPGGSGRGFVFGLFGEVDEASALSRCPEIIRGIAHDVMDACDAPAPGAAAAALAVAAQAIGTKTRVAVPHAATVAPAFNLLIGHAGTRGTPWLDIVTAPLVARVFDMQVALHRDGRDQTRDAVAQQERDLKSAMTTVTPNPALLAQATLDLARLRARLKPAVVIPRFCIEEIGRALPEAFDPGLVSINAGTDPIDDLTQVRPAERRELARLLNSSWQGRALSIDGGLQPGTISLLCSTPVENLRHFSSWREFHTGAMPVPLLILLSLCSQPDVPPARLSHEAEWNRTVNALFDSRCMGMPVECQLIPEGEKRLHEFAMAIHTGLPGLPEPFRNHLPWLPDLARRLSLVFWVLTDGTSAEVPLSAVESAVAVTRWLGAAHLRALMSALWIPGEDGLPASTAPAAKADAATVMLAKISAKGPMTRRELWRSYNKPRAETFNAALGALHQAGKVRLNEAGALFAIA